MKIFRNKNMTSLGGAAIVPLGAMSLVEELIVYKSFIQGDVLGKFVLVKLYFSQGKTI